MVLPYDFKSVYVTHNICKIQPKMPHADITQVSTLLVSGYVDSPNLLFLSTCLHGKNY